MTTPPQSFVSNVGNESARETGEGRSLSLSNLPRGARVRTAQPL
jgi:hypothetical protein